MDDVTLRAQFIDEASRPIEDLGKSAEDTADKIVKSSKREKSAAEKAVAAIEGSHKRTRKSYDKTERAAAKAGAAGGKKWGVNMSRAVDASKSKAAGAANKVAGKMGDALKSKGAAIGTAVGVLIGGSIASAIETETAKTNLEIKTGTLGGVANKNMGESMDGEVGATASKLYERGFGTDAADVSKIVDSIARIPGAWDEGAEGAANFGAGLGVISGAFEQDAASMGSAIGIMMNNGMASSGTGALDMITKTMQDASPLVRDEILENVSEYAKHYDQLGISSEDMFGLILAGSENGVIGVDKMGDAMKELGIRAADGSKASVGALDAIGLNGTKIMDDIAAGGERGGDAFQKIVAGLDKIESPAEKAQTAIALFGGPLEDLGTQNIPAFLDALSSGAGGITDFAGATAAATDAVEQGPAQQIEILKRKMLGSFSAIGAEAMPYLMPLLSFLQTWAPLLAPIAIGLGTVAIAIGIVTGATAAWTAVMLMNPTVLIIMGIVAVIALLVAGFVWAYNNVTWFKTGVDGAVTGIKNGFAGLSSWWTNSFMPVLQSVGAWFDTYLISPIRSVVDWIGTAIDKMGGLTGIMEGIGNFMADPGGAIGAALGFAGGGVVPGYAPGQDSVPAVLSPGEAVLVPEAVRALGTDWVYSVNRAYSSRTPGTPEQGVSSSSALIPEPGREATEAPRVTGFEWIESPATPTARATESPIVELPVMGAAAVDAPTLGVDMVSAPPLEKSIEPKGVGPLKLEWIHKLDRSPAEEPERFAGGGVLAGYAPGHDSVSALLSPGEAVLVPELVKALGADWVYKMNRAYSGRKAGGTSATVASQRFAGGGLAKAAPRAETQIINNNVTVKVVGNLATGVTVEDIEAAVERTLAKTGRRKY